MKNVSKPLSNTHKDGMLLKKYLTEYTHQYPLVIDMWFDMMKNLSRSTAELAAASSAGLNIHESANHYLDYKLNQFQPDEMIY